MALLISVWYSLLALLGLSIRPDAPPTELTPGDVCPWLEVANGYANCDHVGSQIFCNVRCDGKHQGDFTWTKDKGWTPELPSCARQIGDGDVCPWLEVTKGFATCDHVGSQIFCNVVCDGKNQGDFTWTKDKGWTPELPLCARQIGGTENDIKEVLKAESGGCPNVNACAKYCRSQGNSMGMCIGPGRATCICRRI